MCSAEFSYIFQSQCRAETMLTLEKVVNGLGSGGSSAYKDIYKASKQAMSDRAMAVRTAAAKVGLKIIEPRQVISNNVAF